MTDESIAERKMQFLFTLRTRGVTDSRTLAAMEKVDRGEFLRGLFAERAYEDMPLPIACGQTISQPSIVGLMTQAMSAGAVVQAFKEDYIAAAERLMATLEE